jgi:hypothetical protein
VIVSPYRVLSIGQDVAWSVRATLRSPQGEYPAYVDVATAAGPCRVCLCPFEVGVDRAILFIYDPFAVHESCPLPSPVLIHERGCATYRRPRIDADLAAFPLTVNGYGTDRQVVAQVHAGGPSDVHDVINRMLERPAVDYVHLRSTDLGCFVCEVVRRAADDGTD